MHPDTNAWSGEECRSADTSADAAGESPRSPPLPPEEDHDDSCFQERLLQTEKLSALGQLVSGVAHELNNPLTAVVGFSQLLKRSPRLTEKEREWVERIRVDAERTRRIVESLLAFARQRKPERDWVDLRSVLRGVMSLRAYEMKVSNIDLAECLEPDLPRVWADEHQLQQVFVNLIINAEQAMLGAHDRGLLRVRARHDRACGLVRVVFEDDGPGIPEECFGTIFQPFFTTKDPGKGTGLGLSISYGILQDHGGAIRAENRRGGGARFTLELPVQPERGNPQGDTAREDGHAPAVQAARLLVVDDEPGILELIRVILEDEGHLVVTADGGEEALDRLDREEFDAVLTDLRMPNVSGLDVYLDCKARRPDVARSLLVLTGDTVRVKSLAFLEAESVPCLGKPFRRKDLLAAVRRLLG